MANFLWSIGTGSTIGTIATVTLMTTEFGGVTNSSFCVGATTFTSTYSAQGIWGDVYWTEGQIGSTTALSAGANLAGYFLNSLDGGTTFESSSTVPVRAPDFLIPLPATTISGSAPPFKSNGQHAVKFPVVPYKVLLANNTGQTITASSTAGGTGSPSLKGSIVAVSY